MSYIEQNLDKCIYWTKTQGKNHRVIREGISNNFSNECNLLTCFFDNTTKIIGWKVSQNNKPPTKEKQKQRK
jgi:hypothetical protein